MPAAPAAETVDSPAHKSSSLSWTFWFGQMDLRPLALFRIVFALFIAYDLLDLLFIATQFFSDSGVMPRVSLLTSMARANRFALSDVLGPVEVVYVYWAIAFALSIMVALGYRTRLTTVLLYLFVAGFNERLPELFDGSDSVIRLSLFWLCFAPSGNRYSLDALRAQQKGIELPKTASAITSRILQAQIAWVYICSALHKTGGNTWHLLDQTGNHLDLSNSALHYVLHLNHVFARPWASVLADYPIPMAFGTVFTMIFEGGFIFLVFSPILNKWTKALGLLMGVALHGGIALTVNVGLFSYLMPVTYFIFFEPAWTEWVIDQLARLCGKGAPTAVIYDGKCAACARGVETLRSMDRFGKLELVDVRSGQLPKAAEAIKRNELEGSLHAVLSDGTLVAGWPALRAALRRTPGGFVVGQLGGLPFFAQLGGVIYSWASQNRHARAKVEAWTPELPALRAPVLPVPERVYRTSRDLLQLAALVLFISAAWYASPQPGRRYLPMAAERAVQWTSIWNIWDMFSPEPLRTDYHLRAPAEYSDGSTEDLFGGPVDGPGEVRGFWFTRWWKYLENVTQGAKVIQEEWARWQCKQHNWGDGPREHGGKTLYRFRLLRDNQIIPPIGQPWPPVQTAEIVNWRCFDKPDDKGQRPSSLPQAEGNNAPPPRPPLISPAPH
ncbi:MAG: DUF393 domain-containing protein [Deltaproteobacteria bacterium]|nr:DUF393 domain-containing protein [Deltaproteobacteria bacterium]